MKSYKIQLNEKDKAMLILSLDVAIRTLRDNGNNRLKNKENTLIYLDDLLGRIDDLGLVEVETEEEESE